MFTDSGLVIPDIEDFCVIKIKNIQIITLSFDKNLNGYNYFTLTKPNFGNNKKIQTLYNDLSDEIILLKYYEYGEFYEVLTKEKINLLNYYYDGEKVDFESYYGKNARFSNIKYKELSDFFKQIPLIVKNADIGDNELMDQYLFEHNNKKEKVKEYLGLLHTYAKEELEKTLKKTSII